MSLVALVRSAPAGTGTHSGPSRPVASSTTPAKPAPPRPNAVPRAERVATSSRPGAGFATILDAARDQEAATAAGPEAAGPSAHDLAKSGRDVRAEASGANNDLAGPVVAPPTEPPPPALPHTPWLLLALSLGTRTRADDVAVAEPETTLAGEASEPSMERACEVAGTAPASSTRPAVPVPQPQGLAQQLAGQAPPAAQAVDLLETANLLAPVGPLPCAAAPDAEPQPGVAAVEAAPPASLLAGAGGSFAPVPTSVAAAVGAADATLLEDATPAAAAAATQPPDVLARWRTATRASGGLFTAVMSLPREGRATAGAATGQGVDARHADAGAATAGADGFAGAAGAPTSTWSGSLLADRAGDALFRLAQRDGQPQAGRDGTPALGLAALLPAATLPVPTIASAATAAPVLPAAVADQVMQQLVSSLKMQWKDGVGEARLHLRPDALGAVTVSLRVEHGAVTAVVRAESAQVNEWVLQHQQSLRQQMEAAGLHLTELVVSPDDQRQQPREDASPEPRRQRRPRPGGAEAAETLNFELLV